MYIILVVAVAILNVELTILTAVQNDVVHNLRVVNVSFRSNQVVHVIRGEVEGHAHVSSFRIWDRSGREPKCDVLRSYKTKKCIFQV